MWEYVNRSHHFNDKLSLLLPLALAMAGCNPDPHRHFSGRIVEPLWKVSGLQASAPRIHRGVVYVTAFPPKSDPEKVEHVYAYDLKTGRALWVSDFIAERIEAVYEGTVYASGPAKTGHLGAFEGTTGKVLWTSDFAVGKVLFVMGSRMLVTEADSSGPEHLLDRLTGRPAAPPAQNPIVRAAVEENVLYTVSWLKPTHFVTAWDQPEHALWRADLPDQDFAGPIVSGNAVYYFWAAPPNGSELYAFDRRTGAMLWKWTSQEYTDLRGVQADTKTVYLSVYGKTRAAIALDAATGKAKWTVRLEWNSEDYYFKQWDRSPQLFDVETVMFFGQPKAGALKDFGDRDHLDNRGKGFTFLALNRGTGAVMWQSQARWKYESWTAQDGLLFVADDGPHDWTTSNYKHRKDNWLTVVDIRSGKELWRSDRVELSSLSTPEIEDGILVTTSHPGGNRPAPGIFAYPATRKPKR